MDQLVSFTSTKKHIISDGRMDGICFNYDINSCIVVRPSTFKRDNTSLSFIFVLGIPFI